MTNLNVPKAAADGAAPGKPGWSLAKLAPLAILIAVMGVAYAFGLHKYLSFETIGMNYDALKTFIARNLVAAVLLYMLAYMVVVALSLPAGLLMTLAGGLFFGWQIGAPATVIGATAGATLIFLIAKTSLGEALARQAGPWLARLQDGFKENALSYLLFLRLVPVFPFAVVNLAPAFLGVPLRTYVIGTLLGIIPGTTAFSVAGAGLGSVVEAQNAIHKSCLAKAGAAAAAKACEYKIDTSALVTRELILAFALIGVVALIPVALKKWKQRHAAV
jgi:uncharacterized membrane protein YdjX (TVP38/TMEM64 family)